MKFVHPEIESVIDVDCGLVNEVVIENQKFFSSLVEDINLSINGIAGKTILSIKDKSVDLSKYALTITEFAPLQLNKKTLITKITQILEKEAINESNYVTAMELLAKIESFLLELGLELPCEIEFTKVNVGNLIKAMSPEIVEGDKPTIEKLFDFMEFVRELEREKLFILINARSYFSDEDMESFVETILAHDQKVILLETQTRPKLNGTQRLTIDKDLCEF